MLIVTVVLLFVFAYCFAGKEKEEAPAVEKKAPEPVELVFW